MQRAVQATNQHKKLTYLVLGFLLLAVTTMIFSKPVAADLTAPDGTPYYYISKDIAANGDDYPATAISFYWKSSEGKAKIIYKGIKCNDGGYNNKGNPGPKVTITALDSQGATTGSPIGGTPKSLGDKCDNGENTNFYIDISSLPVDPRTGLKGVQVKVEATNKGRAWFELMSDAADSKNGYAEADYFGAQGNIKVSFSKDTKAVDPGNDYDFNMQFGNVCNETPSPGLITFYDMDSGGGSKYQDGKVRFRIGRVTGTGTVTWLDNDLKIFSIPSDGKVSRVNSGDDNYFQINAGSGTEGKIWVNMQSDTRYIVKLYGVSYRNDVAVSVPTDEIYGKASCRGWNISGSTAVSSIIANPGQQVTFTHYVKDDGPANTDKDIYADTAIKTSPGAPVAEGMRAFSSTNIGSLTPGDANKKTPFTNMIKIPDNATPGQQYCEQVGYLPKSNVDSGRGVGEWACVTVGSSYALTPHVETPKDAVSRGDTVTFTPNITKDRPYDSNATNWKFCRLVVLPGSAVPAAGSLCSNPGATVVESKDNYVFKGSGPFAVGDSANHTYTVPDSTSYGSRICYALLVDSSTQDPGNPAEAVRCVTVAKYPTVHILGGDVKVGDSTFAALVNQNASIQTGSFNVSGRSYGSWAEYGLFAPASGKIISSSGGMLSGTNGADAATVNPVSQNGLTFANVTTYGYWAPAGLLTMPTAIASAASANSSVATTQVDVGANVSAASGEVRAWNITAPGGTVNVRGTLPAGSGSVILLYNGTVNINGDIRLGDSTVRSLGNNSQVIIVARNITIDPSVSNVDAWLIATPSTSVSNDGRISTCGAIQTDAYYTGLTLGGECDTTPLRITGTVVARELQLRRSFAGSGAGSNAMAAETINLRPDAYMWGNTNGGSVNIETSFVKELPPRL